MSKITKYKLDKDLEKIAEQILKEMPEDTVVYRNSEDLCTTFEFSSEEKLCIVDLYDENKNMYLLKGDAASGPEIFKLDSVEDLKKFINEK